MSINNQPTIFPIPGTRLYEVKKNFHCRYLQTDIIIPKGFRFDGASIPSILWGKTYSPFHPRILKAALVHDYLFFSHLMSFDASNKVFKVVLKESKANQIWMLYKAVCWFGKSSYNEDNKHQTLEFLEEYKNEL